MAKKEPKISVIIPCYNQEKYIKECLNSILNQSFKDFEIIAVDDGSTDNTLNILKSYERIHSNIIVLTQRNKSAGAARNYGLSRAQGKYLLFMDSDDFLDHEAFAILDNITNTEKADIYFYNFRTFDDQTKEVCDKIMFDNLDKISVYNNGKIRYGLTTFEQKKEFFIWSYVAPWNKLYNREFVVKNNLKFDEIFSTNDRTFYFSSLVKSNSIVMMDSILINYRINNSDSLTGTYNESKFNNRKLAFYSSSRYINKKDAELYEAFFKVTILDFVSFFQKANEDNKYNIFLKTVEFFKSLDVRDVKCIHDCKDRFGFYYNFFIDSEYLLNQKYENIVPIVFATNDKYLPYLGVTIESLLKNSTKDKFYDIYIFHTSLSELNQIKITRSNYDNVNIRVVDMNTMVKDLPLYSKSHFSVEMYYRILISELLWQYNKVLYLDCDIIVQSDINNLYNIDLNSNILGVIKNPLNEDMYKYVTNVLSIPENLYFNSGILLINTNLFKKHNVKNLCFEILAMYKNLACPDQDILNLSCLNKCLYIDEMWNFQTGNQEYTVDYKYKSCDKINIIHFTTGNKPWNTQNLPLSEIFWAYARKTIFYEDILYTYLNSTLKLEDFRIKEKTEQHKNIINNQNQKHYTIINPYSSSKLSNIKRLINKFFVSLKNNGLKVTLKKVINKIKNRKVKKVNLDKIKRRNRE